MGFLVTGREGTEVDRLRHQGLEERSAGAPGGRPTARNNGAAPRGRPPLDDRKPLGEPWENGDFRGDFTKKQGNFSGFWLRID